jgi:ubiquitin C-terminal hydrolase
MVDLLMPLPLVLCLLLRLFREYENVEVSTIRKTGRREQSQLTYYAPVTCILCGLTVFAIYLSERNANSNIFFYGLCGCPPGCRRLDLLFEHETAEAGRIWWYMNFQREAQELQLFSYYPSRSMRHFCRWHLHFDRVFDRPSRTEYMKRCYSRSSWRRMKLAASHTECLSDLIHFLSHRGYTQVIGSPVEKIKTRFVHANRDVAALIWIAPWAITAYKAASHIQLDCSFRATRPFVYCVPMAIIRNEAVPLGFIMTPTESAWTYTTFMETLWDLMASGGVDNHYRPPVLSDQGPGLISFCIDHAIRQFFCHRHLIEKFGSSSPAGMLAARVLRLQTRDEFIELRPQFVAEAQELYAKGLMSVQSLVKFRNWLEADPENFRDGLWHRIKEGIPRCSNHAERFHGVVNQRIRNERVYALPRRLRILYDEIVLKAQAYNDSEHRQLTESIRQMKRLNTHPRQQCHDAECAIFCEMMNARYGIEWFPCPHTAWRPMGEVNKLPSLLNEADWAIFDSYREAILVKMAKKGRRKVPGFGTAQFNANCPPLIRKKKNKVLVWDDEKGPDEHAGLAEQIPRWRIARGIVTGVLYLRRRSKRCPPIDPIAATVTILADLTTKYEEMVGPWSPDAAREPPTAAERKWLAEYAVPWYRWAMKNRNCPVQKVIPAPPAFEEEPFENDCMAQPTFTDTSDIEELQATTKRHLTRRVSGPLSLAGMFKDSESSQVSATQIEQKDEPEEEEEEDADESGSEQDRQPDDWFRPPAPPTPGSSWLEAPPRFQAISQDCPRIAPQPVGVAPASEHRRGSINPRTLSVAGLAQIHSTQSHEASCPRPPGQPRGLQNTGITCYFNACVQCFLHLEPLRSYVVSPSYENHMQSQDGVAQLYRDLQQRIDDKTVIPKKFLAHIIPRLMPLDEIREATRRRCQAAAEQDQGQTLPDSQNQGGKILGPKPSAPPPPNGEDLPEGLMAFLDCLHRDLTVRVDGNFVDEGLNSPDPAVAHWAVRCMSDYSIIRHLFWGLIRSERTCDHCQNCSVSFEPEVLISLNIPPGISRISLEDLIAFFAARSTTEGNCPFAPEKQVVPAVLHERLAFGRLPPVLMFQVARFGNSNGETPQTWKTATTVTYQHYLDMSRWVSTAGGAGPCTYRLHSVIEHRGKMHTDTNHYFASVRVGDAWYSFNDSQVKQLNDSQALTMKPYVLFYVQGQEG